ncbi:hypothetical protein STA1M1_14280 [Sinisalibacter aestuarii]|uniref:HNH domain-containing protein n=2 Tax=Sinisalibacter aestuarii TaxID=2949426 RepID=A0ABQ5LRD1_9RHOB|nr:hypothetical protein STA1M1_14280 [Sinisalibacter aestuarii]
MAFAPKDTKLLWGRAAGICSNPECRKKLTATGADGKSFLTGEMAHQIAQSPDGPRGADGGGDDTYDNLILLCPTCHRTIDKAPEGTFPVELLKEWKKIHEDWVDSWATEGTYKTSAEVAKEIQRLLIENRTHFEEYGPKSDAAAENPASTAQAIWAARKLDTLLPNNRRIVSLMEKYSKMMPDAAISSFPKFKMHAEAFEGNQYERVEKYPLFPSEFAEAIEEILE